MSHKPIRSHTAARRYVYRMLAASLEADIRNAAWVNGDDVEQDIPEAEVRLIRQAAAEVLREFVAKSLIRPDDTGWMLIDGRECKLCRFCGQPMRPRGVKKLPNEYDHAKGCPRAPAAAKRSLVKGGGIG